MAQRRVLLVGSTWTPIKFISEKAAFRLVKSRRAERCDVSIELYGNIFRFNTCFYPIRQEDMRFKDLIDTSYHVRLAGWW